MITNYKSYSWVLATTLEASHALRAEAGFNFEYCWDDDNVGGVSGM